MSLLLTGVLLHAGLLPGVAHAGCLEATAAEPALPPADSGGAQQDGVLQELVQEALRQSRAVGAARLLADAATSELEAARVAGRPRLSLSSTLAQTGGSRADGPSDQGRLARGSLHLSAPLYDAGQLGHLAEWRARLAEAAALGRLGAEEQVALQTVSLAIERSRYRAQIRVYRQQQERLSCLVDALQQIVQADRGRASELVQARKSLLQAELAAREAAVQARLTETRLRRFVGDGLPVEVGLPATLLQLPARAELQQHALRAHDLAQLDAQARALQSQAQAIEASQKPQANWALSGSRSAVHGTNTGQSSTDWSAGVQIQLPLLDPGAGALASAARLRASSARLQHDDALEARLTRLAELHAQAQASTERVIGLQQVIESSQQVRQATLRQWAQLGRRSLFDVMAAESEHHSLWLSQLNARHDAAQAAALLWSLGPGLPGWLAQARSETAQ